MFHAFIKSAHPSAPLGPHSPLQMHSVRKAWRRHGSPEAAGSRARALTDRTTLTTRTCERGAKFVTQRSHQLAVRRARTRLRTLAGNASLEGHQAEDPEDPQEGELGSCEDEEITANCMAQMLARLGCAMWPRLASNTLMHRERERERQRQRDRQRHVSLAVRKQAHQSPLQVGSLKAPIPLL